MGEWKWSCHPARHSHLQERPGFFGQEIGLLGCAHFPVPAAFFLFDIPTKKAGEVRLVGGAGGRERPWPVIPLSKPNFPRPREALGGAWSGLPRQLLECRAPHFVLVSPIPIPFVWLWHSFSSGWQSMERLARDRVPECPGEFGPRSRGILGSGRMVVCQMPLESALERIPLVPSMLRFSGSFSPLLDTWSISWLLLNHTYPQLL